MTVDSVAPETTLTATPTDPSGQTTATFSFSSSESGSSFSCRLDGAGFEPCDSPRSYAGLAEGPHAFEVKATDAAGNTDPTAATRTWTVNAGLPARPVITAPADGSSSASATLAVRGTAEAGVTVRLFEGDALLGATTATAGGDWALTDLAAFAEGTHALTATATSAAGTSAPTSPIQVTVDTTFPETSIESGPPAVSRSTSASLTFSSDEVGVSFECRLDNGTFGRDHRGRRGRYDRAQVERLCDLPHDDREPRRELHRDGADRQRHSQPGGP